jgi:hypothetical protein
MAQYESKSLGREQIQKRREKLPREIERETAHENRQIERDGKKWKDNRIREKRKRDRQK